MAAMQDDLQLVRFADDSGYVATESDIRAVGIELNAILDLSPQLCPLGMTRDDYAQFLRSLKEAVRLDGLSSIDIRLKGSSTQLFSGTHKSMLYERIELYQTYRILRSEVPDSYEIDRAMNKILKQWPPERVRPRRLLFDCLYWLGIAAEPSDYDLQVSSNQIKERIAVGFEGTVGAPPSVDQMSSPNYAFFAKDLVAKEFRYLTAWSLRQERILGRVVTIAAFAEGGPKDTGQSSSNHFRPSDWIIIQGSGDSG